MTQDLLLLDRSLMGYRKGYTQIGDIWTSIASGGGVVSSAVSSGTAATLFTSAAAAQALPVIGQIAGTVAVVAGLIARSRSKVNALKAKKEEVDAVNQELRLQNVELGKGIADTYSQMQSIDLELQRIGLKKFTR